MDLEIRKNEIYDKMVLSTEGPDALKESVLSAMEQYAEDYHFEKLTEKYEQMPYQTIDCVRTGTNAKQIALEAARVIMPFPLSPNGANAALLVNQAEEIYRWLIKKDADDNYGNKEGAI